MVPTLMGAWQRLLTARSFLTIAGQGYGAVVHYIGEQVDEWARATLPPYSAACTMCEAASQVPGIADCNAARIQLRDEMITELLALTGLEKVIRQMLKLLACVPSEVLDAFSRRLPNYGVVADLYTDPDLGELIQYGVNHASEMSALGGEIVAQMDADHTYGAYHAAMTRVIPHDVRNAISALTSYAAWASAPTAQLLDLAADELGIDVDSAADVLISAGSTVVGGVESVGGAIADFVGL